MEVIYAAGPYRGRSKNKLINFIQRQINIYRAAKVAKELWKIGYAVMCPHLNSANFDGAAPDQSFLDGDIEILKRCDKMVLVQRWEKSKGTLKEIGVARDCAIPIFEYLPGAKLRKLEMGRWIMTQ